MTASCFDISVGSAGWKIADKPSEMLPAYPRSDDQTGQPYIGGLVGSPASYISYEMQPPAVVGVEPPAEDKIQIRNWAQTWMTGLAASSSTAITAILSVEKAGAGTSGLEIYKAMIESLPIVKRAQLWNALRKINGYLLDIEASDDGEIIIETKEDGKDCFYAICTREGDFKGTWISEGILKKESWSASPPFNLNALSLI